MRDKLRFKRLFEPINIGTMTVRNRIAMPGMMTGFFSENGLLTERAKSYYEARAKGGAGLVIVECTCVDFPRGYLTGNPLIDSDLALPGLTELAQVIKKHSARAIIQLYHTGRLAKSNITGFQPVAPSPIPYPVSPPFRGEMPRELTVGEISEVVGLFAQAAVRAKKAGFEGIEVHAGHAHLLAQFLSPCSNKRLDQYGGSVENRARMLIEVLRSIRESVGDDYPLWCRINGQEYGIEDTLTLDNAKATALMVNDIVDAIHVTAWGYRGSAMVYLPDVLGAFLPLAEEIKKVVTVPVIVVGRLTPEVGEQAIEEGKADIIAMGRGLIADPELPNKVLLGQLEDVIPCITCFHCSDVRTAGGIGCAINASVGRETEYEIKPAKVIKKIAVIGGGPAGMEAARVLALRGHKVVLFEKEDRLGGQASLAMVPPHKQERLKPWLDYLVTQVNKLNVEVRLSTKANLELIESVGPDVVVLATGAEPVVPEIPGVDLGNVVTATDILAGRAEAGNSVVIIGGGSIGCETAEFLFEKEKEVTVVEMLPELATDMTPRDRIRLLSRIAKLPITFHKNAKCSEIREDRIKVVTKDEKEQVVKADTVVVAVGTKQNNSLFQLLRAKGVETHLVGDCMHLNRIPGAIIDSLRLGCVL